MALNGLESVVRGRFKWACATRPARLARAAVEEGAEGETCRVRAER